MPISGRLESHLKQQGIDYTLGRSFVYRGKHADCAGGAFESGDHVHLVKISGARLADLTESDEVVDVGRLI